MVIKEATGRESCLTYEALASKGLLVHVSVCTGLKRTSDPMALELQAGVNCPLWVLATVAGPLQDQQGSQSSLQPLSCLL